MSGIDVLIILGIVLPTVAIMFFRTKSEEDKDE